MVRIDYNELPRSARERFIRALASDPPHSAPICSRPAVQRRAIAWLSATAGALVVIGALAAIRFGRVDAPVQDRRFLAGYVVACGVFGCAIAVLLRRRTIRRSLPFAPGVYVLPVDVVDARQRELELHSLLELVSAEPVHHVRARVYTHSTLWLVFQAQTFTFDVRGKAYAEGLLTRLADAKMALSNATQRNRIGDLWEVDPFAEARASSFEPTADDEGVRAHEPPIWTRFVWAIAIISALLPGVAVWRVRNWSSDRRAYATLRLHPDSASAEAYLAHGGLHVGDVKTELAPRLRLATAKGLAPASERVDALHSLLEAYPSSNVDADARAALAQALHALFLEQNTVSGLRAFVARWPDSADAPAAKAKVHDLYRETLSDLRRNANPSDKAIATVAEAVLSWGEEAGAPVEVRFRKRNVSSLAAVDKLLAAGLLDEGGKPEKGNAELFRYFGPGEIEQREATLVRGLQRAFRGAFPADVVAFEVGAPITDINERGPLRIAPPPRPLPDVTRPTIVVDYELGWNGIAYVSKSRRRRYLGVYAKLEVMIQVPKEPRVLAFPLRIGPPDSFPIDERTNADDDDEHVYDLMLLRACEASHTHLAAVFLEPRTAQTR